MYSKTGGKLGGYWLKDFLLLFPPIPWYWPFQPEAFL
jgi:hypothetical protein